MDTWHFMEIYSDARRIEIGMTFNSRLGRGIGRRGNKFFLKRFPKSSPAKTTVDRGLRYENLLLHKSYNLQHCSTHLSGKSFFNNWDLTTLLFAGQEVWSRTVESDIYNCVYNYQDKPKDIGRTKNLHLAGIAQQPNLFPGYVSRVEAELSVRGY